MDADRLDERLHAVERALTGDDTTLPDLEDSAGLARRLDGLEDRLDAVDAQLDDLDAATQALRGYVGNVRSVNRDVERRADLALSRVERVASRLDREAQRPQPTQTGTQSQPNAQSHSERRTQAAQPNESSQSGAQSRQGQPDGVSRATGVAGWGSGPHRPEWWDGGATPSGSGGKPDPQSADKRTFLDRLTEWF